MFLYQLLTALRTYFSYFWRKCVTNNKFINNINFKLIKINSSKVNIIEPPIFQKLFYIFFLTAHTYFILNLKRQRNVVHMSKNPKQILLSNHSNLKFIIYVIISFCLVKPLINICNENLCPSKCLRRTCHNYAMACSVADGSAMHVYRLRNKWTAKLARLNF